MLSVCSASFAQTQLSPLSWNQLLQPQLKSTTGDIRDQFNNRFKSSNLRGSSYWISYALDQDSLNGFTASLSGNFLFPDSNVLVNFSDGFGGVIEGSPFIHELGDVVDPLSFVFQYIDGVNFTSATPYFVDSAGVVMAYERTTDASIVDTLVVYMFEAANGGSNLPSYYYTGGSIAANFGYDTVYVPFIKYNHSTNKPTAAALKTFKIPLYEEDSSSYYYFKLFSTNNMSVPAGHKVAMAVTFKPGYAYSEFENINNSGNVMFFASYEENGPDTYPTYIPDEANVSSIIPTSVRYNIDAGYNGLFIPGYAYTSPYSWERHLFLYHITDELSGVNDPANSFADFSITPNPANDLSTIDFTLSNSSDVVINIFDVTGKLLGTKSLGQLGKGQHTQTLDVSKLDAGIYMVSIESGSLKAAQKLVVAK